MHRKKLGLGLALLACLMLVPTGCRKSESEISVGSVESIETETEETASDVAEDENLQEISEEDEAEEVAEGVEQEEIAGEVERAAVISVQKTSTSKSTSKKKSNRVSTDKSEDLSGFTSKYVKNYWRGIEGRDWDARIYYYPNGDEYRVYVIGVDGKAYLFWQATYEYDKFGNLVKQVSRYFPLSIKGFDGWDETITENYTYDEKSRMLTYVCCWDVSGDGDYPYDYYYRRISVVYTDFENGDYLKHHHLVEGPDDVVWEESEGYEYWLSNGHSYSIGIDAEFYANGRPKYYREYDDCGVCDYYFSEDGSEVRVEYFGSDFEEDWLEEEDGENSMIEEDVVVDTPGQANDEADQSDAEIADEEADEVDLIEEDLSEALPDENGQAEETDRELPAEEAVLEEYVFVDEVQEEAASEKEDLAEVSLTEKLLVE